VKAVILDAGSPATCHPLTVGRDLGLCRVANRTLVEVQTERLKRASLDVMPAVARGPAVYVRGDMWFTADAVDRLAAVEMPAVLQDGEGEPLAWLNSTPDIPRNARRVDGQGSARRIRYPWDVLAINEELLSELRASRIEGELAEGVNIEGHLVLGPGSRILPGVFIEGNVAVGAGTKIGPNCYLRGNTSIGSRCHIGQAVEIKNSIIMDGTSIGHLSYCGDSIIGAQVNFGAGTITANFRHDGLNHRSRVEDRLIDTGRRKFGAVVGDHVHTGIHTSIYPGRKLWPHVTTRPGEIVKDDRNGNG
jgi:UDP-N-acetylglucosamine diphosphorylase / glucose-1-phosphate thymidylyltransferase / UDP-N-acetylgalactosamine diphosphorylase / glucosamine-1-phosphate N-acetyltransferase / galactosamine-1-phosphate N-acetyltransferase